MFVNAGTISIFISRDENENESLMRIRLRGSCSWLPRRLCYLSRRGWVTLTLQCCIMQFRIDHTFISSVWSIWTSEVFSDTHTVVTLYWNLSSLLHCFWSIIMSPSANPMSLSHIHTLSISFFLCSAVFRESWSNHKDISWHWGSYTSAWGGERQHGLLHSHNSWCKWYHCSTSVMT